MSIIKYFNLIPTFEDCGKWRKNQIIKYQGLNVVILYLAAFCLIWYCSHRIEEEDLRSISPIVPLIGILINIGLGYEYSLTKPEMQGHYVLDKKLRLVLCLILNLSFYYLIFQLLFSIFV